MSIYPRFLQEEVAAALAEARVTLLQGPRQAGKTTLAMQVAERGYQYISLDRDADYEAARADPFDFIECLDRAVIDEIQRVPELLRPLKLSVDQDPRPGRFLLTGSAHLLTLPRVSESLAGRMDILSLLPLARCEVTGRRSTFLRDTFAGQRPDAQLLATPVDAGFVNMMLAGGYPEALTRSPRGQHRWFNSYLSALLQRDVFDLVSAGRGVDLHRMLKFLAHSVGQLVNFTEVGAAIGVSYSTAQKYVRLLEQMYIVQLLQPWKKTGLSRLVKTPKVHFVDSGLLAHLRETDASALLRDRNQVGPLLESFVVAELYKLCTFADFPVRLYHYRDKSQAEVDVVLEGPGDAIVGIEVKAGATPTPGDFAGLRKLRDQCGDQFVQGILLHGTDRTRGMGDRLLSVPLGAIL